jgi:hypothetical protein
MNLSTALDRDTEMIGIAADHAALSACRVVFRVMMGHRLVRMKGAKSCACLFGLGHFLPVCF